MKKPLKPEADFRAWVKKAESDLKTGEHTLTLKEGCPFDTVCFHAQQCAEKYLKALLVLRSIDFPKTHDLRLLMQRVPADVELGLFIDEVIPLNRYTIEARYPGDWEPIDREEAETAVSIARKVRKAVKAGLPTARRK
jgi:HEPN domain-containing protein